MDRNLKIISAWIYAAGLVTGLLGCNSDHQTSSPSASGSGPAPYVYETSDDRMSLTGVGLKPKSKSNSNSNAAAGSSTGVKAQAMGAIQPTIQELQKKYASIAIDSENDGEVSVPSTSVGHTPQALDELLSGQEKNFTPQQIAALKAYSGPYFRQINSYMRGDMSEYTPTVEAYIDDLKAALVKAPRLPENLVVYRGERNSSGRPVPKIGDEMTFGGFVSTSVNRSVAEEFSKFSDRALIFKIQAAPGQSIPGIYMANLPETEFKNEAEVLIDSSAKFKVISLESVEIDNNGSKTRATMVTLQVRR